MMRSLYMGLCFTELCVMLMFDDEFLFFFFLESYTGVHAQSFEFGVWNLGLCLFWGFLF
jgi:hypothetical protein